VHPLFVERARKEGFWSEALMAEVAARGSVRGLAGVPEAVQRTFATAYDVAPEWHVRMQAAFQRHVQNAVSKTINFPKSATPEDVERVYSEAYRLGCKGVTVYRDGSRDAQVLSLSGREGAAYGGTEEAGEEAAPACPECGAPIGHARQGSCAICLSCGYSRCL
jgi:ribonucleoside-diphosphate reductase alpha chain